MLAMAGLAEAAIGLHLFYSWLMLVVIVVFAVAAAIRDRKWLHVVTSVLIVSFAIMFAPWGAVFYELTVADFEDPDAVHWIGRVRALAITWNVVAFSAMFSTFGFWARRRRINANPIVVLKTTGIASNL